MRCVLFEDDDLLVVNKPAGMNTHAPDPYAGEGIYDWLRHRERRWEKLAIIHRLDKETSGVLVFGKTARANRSLTGQFSERSVQKRYLLVTDGRPGKSFLRCTDGIARAGARYVVRPESGGGQTAETRFRVLPASELRDLLRDSPLLEKLDRLTLVEARPVTGRTHQIRVHAAMAGFPVLGDVLYGGTSADRVYLHGAEVRLAHPASGETHAYVAPFAEGEERQALRGWLIEPDLTDCYRLVHGGSDGWPGVYVDQLGEYLLAQSAERLSSEQVSRVRELMGACGARGAYVKLVLRDVRSGGPETCPQHLAGNAYGGELVVRENGVRFGLSFGEGYSVGLFLDQRDNRRRLLTGHAGAGFELWPEQGAAGVEVLNTFAYTCAFSVCAALAGARTTSLDLSKKYLDWGRTNFVLNEVDPAKHDFIYGDVFVWLKRLARKGRQFDTVLLDPPTFSQSKISGVFRSEKDYGKLVTAALGVLKPGGVLFASCNTAGWPAAAFHREVVRAVAVAGRRIGRERYAPQPPDFPISRAEPAYLKTLWLRVD